MKKYECRVKFKCRDSNSKITQLEYIMSLPHFINETKKCYFLKKGNALMVFDKITVSIFFLTCEISFNLPKLRRLFRYVYILKIKMVINPICTVQNNASGRRVIILTLISLIYFHVSRFGNGTWLLYTPAASTGSWCSLGKPWFQRA